MSNWQTIRSNSSGYTLGVDRNDGRAAQQQHLLVGTAVTGLVRVEWVQARYGQIFPTNWSWVQMWQYMAPGSFMPLGYQVDDAQNLIVATAIAGNYEWLLLYEHDVLPRPDALVRLAAYMQRGDVPVVSGLYFTRSTPSEPLIYRGRGNLAHVDFDLGDLVWADGVPTGFLLVHMSLIRAMWEESEPYLIGDTMTRRVFETPNRAWFDPESGQFNTQAGTSDLAWCERVMRDDFFSKAGWPAYADNPYPFLVDTGIACGHIQNSLNGEVYPPGGVDTYWPAVRAAMQRPLLAAAEPDPAPEPAALSVAVGEVVQVDTFNG